MPIAIPVPVATMTAMVTTGMSTTGHEIVLTALATSMALTIPRIRPDQLSGGASST